MDQDTVSYYNQKIAKLEAAVELLTKSNHIMERRLAKLEAQPSEGDAPSAQAQRDNALPDDSRRRKADARMGPPGLTF